MQSLVLILFLVISAAVTALLSFAALSARGPALAQGEVQPQVYGFRRTWFWVLLFIIACGLAASLPNLPYSGAAAAADPLHVKVTASQFSFDLPAELPYDRPIVLDVTAADVNHGLGIYDPEGRLIAQVQAMPEYVNHLALRFRERGTYTARCMEFCGVGHAAMHSTFEVK